MCCRASYRGCCLWNRCVTQKLTACACVKDSVNFLWQIIRWWWRRIVTNQTPFAIANNYVLFKRYLADLIITGTSVKLLVLISTQHYITFLVSFVISRLCAKTQYFHLCRQAFFRWISLLASYILHKYSAILCE